MIGKRTVGLHAGEDTRDARLSALVSRWTPVDPAADFEAGVWRRIRQEAAARPTGVWQELWDWLRPHPVFAGAATAAAAILLGISAALLIPVRSHARHTEAHALLHPGTLAGDYLALSEGGAP